MYAFQDVVRVCQTSTMAGLRAIHESNGAKPFRFLYMSGANVPRDPTEKPKMLAEYSLMRVRFLILSLIHHAVHDPAM
jgi:hypothetical protein